jgi:hypothetical protein
MAPKDVLDLRIAIIGAGKLPYICANPEVVLTLVQEWADLPPRWLSRNKASGKLTYTSHLQV